MPFDDPVLAIQENAVGQINDGALSGPLGAKPQRGQIQFGFLPEFVFRRQRSHGQCGNPGEGKQADHPVVISEDARDHDQQHERPDDMLEIPALEQHFRHSFSPYAFGLDMVCRSGKARSTIPIIRKMPWSNGRKMTAMVITTGMALFHLRECARKNRKPMPWTMKAI